MCSSLSYTYTFVLGLSSHQHHHHHHQQQKQQPHISGHLPTNQPTNQPVSQPQYTVVVICYSITTLTKQEEAPKKPSATEKIVVKVAATEEGKK